MRTQLEELTYEVFRSWIHQALNHLYDAAFLQNSPLTDLVVPPEDQTSYRGKDLRRKLIAAIHAKEPPRSAPPQSHDWRGYHILEQRFIAGLTPAQVAERLNMSRSLLFMEQARMLESLASNLWEQRVTARSAEATSAAEGLTYDDRAPKAEEEAMRLLKKTTLEPVSLEKLLRSIAPMVRSLGKADRIAIEVDAKASSQVRRGSWVLLRQIIIGLISALISATIEGGIVVRAFENKMHFGILISVDATGGVIDSEDERWDRQRATAHRLLGFMGGELTTVVSAPSHLEVRLQWRQRSETKTLLLVDDNADIADLFRRYLSGTGWRVVRVADAEAARDVLARSRPTVIVLDVLLPKEDGWEFLIALQADPAGLDLPVIICSAVDEPDLARSLGAVDHLPKPLSEQDLREALRPWL